MLHLFLFLTGISLAGCVEHLYRPFSRQLLNPYSYHEATPDELGLPFLRVFFENDKGNRLSSWFIPRSGSDQAVLLCGGNTGSMSHLLFHAKFLWEEGFNVLLFDYQGFGRSQGSADLTSLPGDTVAALRFLSRRPGMSKGKIGLFGISLGSILALYAAGKKPDLVGAVAAEASYDPEDVLRRVLEIQAGPLIAAAASRMAAATLFMDFLEPESSVRSMGSKPLLLIHGEHDRLLPPEASIRLFLKAKGPRRLWLMEQTGHAPHPLVTHDGEYQRQIASFFRRWLPAAGRAGSKEAEAYRWETRPAGDGASLLAIRPNPESSIAQDPEPVEIIAIAPSGHRFARLRGFLERGPAPLLFKVPFRPAAVSLTRYHQIGRTKDGWERRLSEYTVWHDRLPGLVSSISSRLRIGPPPSVLRLRKRWKVPALEAALATSYPSRIRDALESLQKLDSAITDPRLRPMLSKPYLDLGVVFFMRGQKGKAARCLTRSIALAGSLKAHVRLGDARYNVTRLHYLPFARNLLRQCSKKPGSRASTRRP